MILDDYYAKFIRKFIYEPIEKGLVLDELDIRNSVIDKKYRKTRHHSLMNVEVGINALKSQIWQVVGVLKASSSSKRIFENNYAKLMGQSYQIDLFEPEE